MKKIKNKKKWKTKSTYIFSVQIRIHRVFFLWYGLLTKKVRIFLIIYQLCKIDINPLTHGQLGQGSGYESDPYQERIK